MRTIATSRSWNLNLNTSYQPTVSIILPTLNEEKVIQKRLENLLKIDYPDDLVEVLVVDSSSLDRTPEIVREFQSRNSPFKLKLLIHKGLGKSNALNYALTFSMGEVIITTDADCYWPPDTLKTVLPYLFDKRVGVVIGSESFLEPDQTLATRTEEAYRGMSELLRIGQSKLHSTLMSCGELAAFRRENLSKFDERICDDGDMILSLLAKGLRCIRVPQARYYMYTYRSWKANAKGKVRRACALVHLTFKAFVLRMRGRISLPYSVVLPDLYIHIINPLLGILLCVLVVVVTVRSPILMVALLPLFLWSKARRYGLTFVLQNLFLVMGLYKFLSGKRYLVWTPDSEARVVPGNIDFGDKRSK